MHVGKQMLTSSTFQHRALGGRIAERSSRRNLGQPYLGLELLWLHSVSGRGHKADVYARPSPVQWLLKGVNGRFHRLSP
jgi:hypothetical protein